MPSLEPDFRNDFDDNSIPVLMMPDIAYSHFHTHAEAPEDQLPAWRKRVGHIIDVVPEPEQSARGFSGSIDRYAVDGLVFTDVRTDALTLDRSLARISTDKVHNYVFHVFVDGQVGDVNGFYRQPNAAQPRSAILALDMNQPVRMQRPRCQVQSFFAPRELVEIALPDADSIHGRVIENISPLTATIFAHVATVRRDSL